MKRLLLSALLCPLGFIAPAQVTYYVDAARPNNTGAGTSWATAKRDLQVALNGAASGDQVWVKAGTYLPTHDPFGSTTPANNRDKTFTLKNGVKVYGGFAGAETQLSQRNWQTNNTILSGDLGTVNVTADNAYHVLISVNLNAATALDGVTVTKGFAEGPNLSAITVDTRTVKRYYGGGIFNSNAATVFANCRITANSADCDNSNDAWGAGAMNDNCTSAYTNCVFDGNFFPSGGNSFGVKGAGMYIFSGSCTLTSCAFVNNIGNSGFFDGSSGGAIYMNTGTTNIVNTIFYNNSAMNGAALSLGGDPHVPVVTNCTFANNTSSYAGTAYSGFSKGTFRNCIFWNNAPTSSSVAGRNEILSMETDTAKQPTFINCIVRDGVGNPSSVLNTKMNACINTNPLFTNLADGDGADNVFMTADDGLRLQCGSPAIGAGSGTTPTTDILNLARVGTLDIGAYEGIQAAAPFNTIPSANTTIQLGQNAAGTTNYSDCVNEVLKIQSGGAYTLGGIVTSKVWIEATQPSRYVKRHYEITPQTNAAAATARITLYFKQQEFNDFNAVNAVQLPTGPSDAAGIANIKIEKKSGSSNNSTGLPDSYTGSAQTLSGSALAISWNAAAARWEISFDVAGFSGFFLKTQSTVLPLRLLSFSGKQGAACNELQWKTANEINTREFEIQKSAEGRRFYSIGTTPAAGSGNSLYEYKDCPASSGKAYYRLKMIDNDGQFTYSTVVSIDGKQEGFAELYPNPAKDYLLIAANDATLMHTKVRVTDPAGRLLMQATIEVLPYKLNLEQLPAGLYYLQFEQGRTLRFVKQR